MKPNACTTNLKCKLKSEIKVEPGSDHSMHIFDEKPELPKQNLSMLKLEDDHFQHWTIISQRIAMADAM